MYEKKFIYIKPEKGITLSEQAADCFAAIKKTLKANQYKIEDILKQTIFINTAGNDEFAAKKSELTAALERFYGSLFPPTAVVGQPPEEQKLLAIELIILKNRDEAVEISRKKLEDITYITVQYPDFKEVYAAGCTAAVTNSDVYRQSKTSFDKMKQILEKENLEFSDVLRQWNYIENITGSTRFEDGDKQNYQVFNDVRSIYYDTADFTKGYPAATGIGMNCGGIVLEFIAAKEADGIRIFSIRNPDQVNAHQYDRSYLVGQAIKLVREKTTPKFERAKLLANDSSYFVYISGTAAIKGQEVVAIGDVQAQTHITTENIARLISHDNLKKHGLTINHNSDPLSYVRVYVKREGDIPQVKKICSEYYEDVPSLYLISDICRDDLLVEIEGVVEYSSK
ncbi:MAG: hypothetical protein KAT34_00805 [Candidatus Aminicenantes bacterium]|nr:hypothetical protein [Candidatus Aminicenantes bacterium]